MQRNFGSTLLIPWLTVATLAAYAQGTGGSTSAQPEGVESGGYVIHQSVEIGYRGSDVTGSNRMYDTLVNLHGGPRFLEQTLSMQSQTHEGTIFDNLFVDSVGWGGDPNNFLRARMDKNKWYDFRGSFRRDQNNFDYDLLANPLNPSTSSPSIPITASPHLFSTVRRFSDLDFTFLPQSRVTFRFGYSRNNMTGPSFSSVHEGTDALLYQPWDTTLNSYRFGADVKVLSHTVVSYDQFLDYYHGDTRWQLGTATPALLPGGGSVELGLPFDTGNKNPCAITSPATSLIDSTGTLTNTACNAFFAYNRSNHVHTSTSTERISLRSSDLPRAELSASYAYSDANMSSPFDEFFNGLSARSRLRQSTVSGPAQANRISNAADFSVTYHVTPHVRVVDTFRYWAYRIPQSFSSSETDWVVPGSGSCALPSCSLLVPISATTQSTSAALDQLSFNQKWTRNQTDLIWDITKHVGVSAGFRYGDKSFTHILDFTTGDQDHIIIHEYTALLGLHATPLTGLRFNFNWERTSNDDTIVRIGPRAESRYRLLARYTPKPWAVISGSMNLWDSSNGDSLVNYRGHNRNYGFNASLNPRERVGFELAYNFNDYQQNALICFNDSNTSLPVVANAGSCLANGYNDDGNPLLTNGTYLSHTHYGQTAIVFKPIPRVTTQIGYSITSVNGNTPQFNALQPSGSLDYNYQQPLANVAVDVGHHLTAIAGWNYYQYGEGSFVGPTDPRYFHANNATISLRWSF